MNEFKRLRKGVRQQAIDAGIVRTVAEEMGVTPATVSRTFAGKFDKPNKRIVEALNRFLDTAGIDRGVVEKKDAA